MTKHIIEFNLPEDEWELNCAMKATNMSSALTEFSEILRTATKHGQFDDKELKDGQIELFEKLREKFHEILVDHGVEL